MSKLLKKYVALKVKDCSKVYLFKNGMFYIFLEDDARAMAPLLHLKLTNLNSTIVKCGFPISSLDKYLDKLSGTSYKVNIVCDEDFNYSIDANDFINNKDFQEILDNFLNTNIDALSISQAYDLLYDLQRKLSKIKFNINNK